MCRINPKVDFAFKKLFGSAENIDILTGLVNSVLEEGAQQREIDIALNMLDARSSVEFVSQITGLSVEQISKLRQ